MASARERIRPRKVKATQFKSIASIPAIEGDFCALWMRDVPGGVRGLCEVFATRVEGGEETGSFHSLVRPWKVSAAMRARCAETIGIEVEELDEAPEIYEIYPLLSKFMGRLDVIVEESEQIELLIRCARYSGEARIPNRLCIAGGYGPAMLLAEAALETISGEHVSGPSLRFRHVRRLKDPNFTSFVAFDTETTGLGQQDMITEIGAVRVEDGEVVDRFQTLVNPGIWIPARIQQFTGITNEMVMGAVSPAEAVVLFKAFAGDSILVAHNANFDLGMLAKAAIPAGIDIRNDCFDTDFYARFFKRRMEWEFTKLGYLAEQLDVPLGRAHRALADAEATAGVYLKLKELGEVEKALADAEELPLQTGVGGGISGA